MCACRALLAKLAGAGLPPCISCINNELWLKTLFLCVSARLAGLASNKLCTCLSPQLGWLTDQHRALSELRCENELSAETAFAQAQLCSHTTVTSKDLPSLRLGIRATPGRLAPRIPMHHGRDCLDENMRSCNVQQSMIDDFIAASGSATRMRRNELRCRHTIHACGSKSRTLSFW